MPSLTVSFIYINQARVNNSFQPSPSLPHNWLLSIFVLKFQNLFLKQEFIFSPYGFLAASYYVQRTGLVFLTVLFCLVFGFVFFF